MALSVLRALSRLSMGWVATLLARGCYRLRVAGREHLPASSPALLVSNPATSIPSNPPSRRSPTA